MFVAVFTNLQIQFSVLFKSVTFMFWFEPVIDFLYHNKCSVILTVLIASTVGSIGFANGNRKVKLLIYKKIVS